MTQRRVVAFICGLCILPILTWGSYPAFAEDEIAVLQEQIQTSNERLQAIEREIAQFEAALNEVGAEKESLQKAINQLELERNKVQADIRYTQNKIDTTDLELNKLEAELDRTEADISLSKQAIAEAIRKEYVAEEQTLVELLLRYDNIAEFWNYLDSQEQVRSALANNVAELTTLNKVLTEKRAAAETRKEQLLSLKSQYDDQSQVLANNRAEQAELLAATRNEEAEYQNLLTQKQAARDELLKNLREFESQLQFILDPNTIPTPGTAVFDWPLKNVIITQYFGGTEFARQNASVYAGRAYHPGIDLGAPRGTQIHAPLAGTVRATGNTDAVPGCYSWGKWTLLDHANGLSTLYAHQDVISVVPGQRVSTGEVIGYVGNTGFSTGPHLHFTVYAKDGVNVRQFNEIKSVTSCGAATTPVAATEAYFDPMLYLPAP